MFNNSFERTDIYKQMLDDIDLSDRYRHILGNSVFCYDFMDDPSPILKFGSACPFYIYVDRKCTPDMIQSLFSHLKDEGYVLDREIAFNRIRNYINPARFTAAGVPEMYSPNHYYLHTNMDYITLSVWRHNDVMFHLLTLRGDTVEIFKAIYHDVTGYICPKCICNYRFSERFDNYDFLDGIEFYPEYIMGHTLSSTYSVIDMCSLYGSDASVPLYQKRYRSI